MARIGSLERPILVHVQTLERREYVSDICLEFGWYHLITLDPDKPEDISDLKTVLILYDAELSKKIGRNEPCPCGSEKKYKKCCY